MAKQDKNNGLFCGSVAVNFNYEFLKPKLAVLESSLKSFLLVNMWDLHQNYFSKLLSR